MHEGQKPPLAKPLSAALDLDQHTYSRWYANWPPSTVTAARFKGLPSSVLVFEYYHDYRAGKLSRDRFVEWMTPVREQFEAALKRAVAADIQRLSGSCANILKHQSALWTFVERDDVQPTNNHAERELRAFVLWRRRSFGTQSDRGNVFAERVMTVAHTTRKQNKNTFAFLIACVRAHTEQTSAPSLFATTEDSRACAA